MNQTREIARIAKITAYNDAIIELYRELNITRDSKKLEAPYVPLIRAIKRVELLKGEVK